MDITFWQINPALLIQDFLTEQTLVFGQMPRHSFDLKDSYNEIKELIFNLKKRNSFTFSEFNSFLKETNFIAQDLFDDLIQLKVIIRAISSFDRYSRHHYYYSLNGAEPDAQKILKTKKVLLIGVGGIGSTCAMLLNAAGVGTLVLADEDSLEESNLTRTVLFDSEDIGKRKVISAKNHLLAKNGNVNIEILSQKLSKSTFEIFRKQAETSDFIILSGDSGPEVHQYAYAFSKEFHIPLLNAGYVETFGIVGPATIGYDKRRESESKTDKPFAERPSAASYGPLNSIVSSISVNETIRYFLKLPFETRNARLVIDSSNYAIEKEDWL